jgi:hypothetical protein
MWWMRRFWDEEDIWFYFELDDEGHVTRRSRFQGPAGTPVRLPVSGMTMV